MQSGGFEARSMTFHQKQTEEAMDPLFQGDIDEHFMRQALREAAAAFKDNEVPVGAVIVAKNRVIARGHNLCETLSDATAHAEMIAITAAGEAAESWRLEDCTLYVTLEPCAMCAGAMVNARVGRLVFGATDEKAGACGSVFDIVREPRLNHRLEVRAGVLAEDCALLLRTFFREKRVLTKNKKNAGRARDTGEE